MKRIVMLTAIACSVWTSWAAKVHANEMDQYILGAWKLQFTAPDGEQHAPVIVVGREYQKYVAWYVANDTPQPFQNVQLDSETLKGTIQPSEHPGITVKVAARSTGADQCAGTASYRSSDGDTGEWNFKGERLQLSSFDETSTWKLNFTSPDYEQHTPTITVVSHNGRWYAWYSGKNHELPARSVRVDGNRVEMKISAQSPDGPRVDVTFRGTVNGDSVRGEAEYQLEGDTGSFPFRGQRVS